MVPGFLSTALAQKDTTKLNQEVEVVKAYRPSVAGAKKINLLPEITDTTRFRPDMNYRFTSHPISSGFKPSALQASNQFQREINYPGIGKVSGGFGSYMTPFLDFYVNNPNSQNGTFGIQLNHLSSSGSLQLKGGSQVDAPFSYNRAMVFGSYVLDAVTISSELNYRRDMNRFYGYPVAIPADILTNNFTKYFNQDQLNQLGYFDLSVKSNATSTALLKFDTGLKLSYFSTNTGQTEKAIRIRSDFHYNFGTFSGKLKANLEHFETDQVTEFPDLAILSSPKSTWLLLSPTLFYQNEFMTLEGGLNLFSVFDDTNGNSFKPYPKASFTFHTSENNFTLYAAIDGSLQNNSYSKMAEENRWLNPTLLVKPSNQLNVFSGGIKGKISVPLAFNLGLKYSKSQEQYFYVTRVENRSGHTYPTLEELTYNNAFEVVYDDMSTLDFSGDLSYTTSALHLLLSGHFYSYSPTKLEKAPYMPDFTLLGSADFKVTDQISAMAELLLTGPRNVMLKYYLPPVASSLPPAPIYLQTDPMVEINLGAKYQLIKNLDLFCKIENLLNRKDEPWYGYTVQGIRFQLGASFSF
jgi:hypothetical protein